MRPQIMTWDQVSKYIYNSNTLLVDLRSKEEYEKGHISGAWNIPYEEVEKFLPKMSGYEKVVFYCAHGNRSLAAARMLAKKNRLAYSVAGGYEEGIRKRH